MMSTRGVVTMVVIWVALAGGVFTAVIGDPDTHVYAPWILILAMLELPPMWVLATAPTSRRLDGPGATLFATMAIVIAFIAALFELARMIAGIEGQHGFESLGPAVFLNLGVGSAIAIMFPRLILSRRHPVGARRILVVLLGIAALGAISALAIPLDPGPSRLSLATSLAAGLWAAPLWFATLRPPQLPQARVSTAAALRDAG